MPKFITLTVLGCLILFRCGNVHADSAGDLVESGNRAYAERQYDAALSSYTEALEERPDSKRILFNTGNAHYKMDEFDDAANAFEQSALNAEDDDLAASARFNQGNALYRKAESLIPSDLSGALEHCKKSVSHYRNALELKPDFREAAENIEIARNKMQSILDQMQQQKEQDKQRQADEIGEEQSDPSNQAKNDENASENPGDRQESTPDTRDGGQDQNQSDAAGPQDKATEEPSGTEKKLSDMPEADADSIISEEQKNRERRNAKISGRHSAIDKDW